MPLQDIQKVDLRLSTRDKDTSKPEKGIYNWTKKVLIDYNGVDRPPDFLTWVRDTGYELSRARVERKLVPVVAPTAPGMEPGKDYDPYFPEGAEITADGRYRYGDVIWCKTQLINEIKRQIWIKEVSGGAAKAKLQEFNEEMEKSGSKLPQDILEKISDYY